MGDFAYNYTAFFTSSAGVDGVPTAWGIFNAISGGNQYQSKQLDELKSLITKLTAKVDDLKSEIGTLKADTQVLKSEVDVLKRGLLTVRVRQEKSIMPATGKTLDVVRIIAKRVVPDALEELDKPKPKIVIPLTNDPFAGAPEL